ncbi:hypothetical protein GOV13_05315 [Candidatus Pacearchaeota archaeon]|nr:hypothetical protein [Candidatus Pacearchaeota archaeon]
MVGYVLLIVAVIVMSTIVYQGLKTYVPREILDCPDGVSVFIKDVNCSISLPNHTLSITLQNNGRFNLGGYFIHATDDTRTVDLSNNLVEVAYQAENLIRFGLDDANSLSPQDEQDYNFDLDGQIYSIAITPVRFQEEDGKLRLASCSNAKVREEVSCI